MVRRPRVSINIVLNQRKVDRFWSTKEDESFNRRISYILAAMGLILIGYCYVWLANHVEEIKKENASVGIDILICLKIMLVFFFFTHFSLYF